MITITLAPQYEKIWPDNPDWLYHQIRTYHALKTNDLVINAYTTGTGKTRASLLYLRDITHTNVLFIAPTNELIRQHVEDIRRFVEQERLNFHVLEVNAALLQELGLDRETSRNGELLHQLVKNPLTFAGKLHLDASWSHPKSIIMVVNPDIFYYGMYFFYKPVDQRNVFEAFFTEFNYIVIDEFHYYNIKQLANFLFFFIISQQFGYLDGTRKICLLSATPNPQILRFLDRIGIKYELLHSENEPAETEDYPKTQTLGTVELQIHDQEHLAKLVQEHAALIRKYIYEDHLDGAIISGALWKINEINSALSNIPDKGRITGAETRENRTSAQYQPLILATPTVDIGFNFQKRRKERQNIDFLFFDGYFQDDFLQRLGRVGRTLGKTITDQKSYAYALTDPVVMQTLAQREQQQYERHEFAELLRSLAEKFPQKNELEKYINSYAIIEAFYPIYQVNRVMPPHLEHLLQELFESIKKVFAPGSTKQFWQMRQLIQSYETRKQLVFNYDRHKKILTDNAAQAKMLREDLALYVQEQGQSSVSPSLLDQLHDFMMTDGQLQEKVITFIRKRYLITQALFHFRESFQGPTAAVFDSKRLLSENAIAQYDLFHLILHFHYHLHERKRFIELAGCDAAQSDFYLELIDFERGRSLVFRYEAELSQKDFDRQFCNEPTIIHPLRIGVLQNQAIIPIYPEIITALEKLYVPCLIVKREDRGKLFALLKKKSIFYRKLFVSVDDSGTPLEYPVVLGTAAFFVYAELYGYFRMKAQQEPEYWIV